MANPVLTEKAFRDARTAPSSGRGPTIPTVDGARYRSASDVMSMSGVISATATLFAILLVAAAYGWSQVKVTSGEITKFPSWTILAILGAFGLSILTSFKPTIARITGPAYALVEGIVVGAISHLYATQYQGIVPQAIGATLGVFAVMLFLYKTNIIKVTDKFRRMVVAATMGLMLFYGVSLLLRLFGANVPFLHSSSAGGILFSLFAAGLASFNLALNFDLIDRNIAAGSPRYMEWYAGFGLMVTIVWLYLELLRLLAKLQDRR